MKRYFSLFSLTLFFSSIYVPGFSQINFPTISHKSTIVQQVGRLTMEVEYERPSARGRKIFGGLVPYGEVWRTGAGYATKIRFSHPVGIANQEVPAGAYTLLSIPKPDTWTLILNTDTTLYGAYDYTEEKDILRFEIPTQQSKRFYETLTIGIDVEPYTAELYISWTSVQLRFSIETYTEQEVEEGIEKYLVSGNSKDPDLYTQAADYYLWADKELDRALSFAQKALELDPSESKYALKAELLIRLDRPEEALEVIQTALQLIEGKYTDPKELASSKAFFEEKRKRIEGE